MSVVENVVVFPEPLTGCGHDCAESARIYHQAHRAAQCLKVKECLWTRAQAESFGGHEISVRGQASLLQIALILVGAGLPRRRQYRQHQIQDTELPSHQLVI